MSKVAPIRPAAQLRELTSREAEVLRLSYLRDRDIGEVLCISIHTVRAHRRNAKLKLGAETKTGAALLAERLAA